ncbi:unnamed protein product [Urochloa humidicola]
MAAQPDADSNVDAIIDIADAAGPSRDCIVCTEPAEWVAVGPCGHGEVCVACAVRLRFHGGNWRCCICRAFCPTVVVTRNAAGGLPQEEGDAFPKPPPVATKGVAAAHAYFASGMAAYFDDERQYEKARRMCLEPHPSLGSSHAPTQEQDYSRWEQVVVIILAIIVTLIGCGTGALVAMSLFGNWRKRIPFVIAGGFLFDMIAYLFWKC